MTKLDQAKLLLEQSQWPALLQLGRETGFKSSPLVVLWLTAAAALADEVEIDRILHELLSNPAHVTLAQNESFLTRLVSVLENTNHLRPAAEFLLRLHRKRGWTFKDLKIADRLSRTLPREQAALSADLLLASASTGWGPAQVTLAESLAEQFRTVSPEKAAALRSHLSSPGSKGSSATAWPDSPFQFPETEDERAFADTHRHTFDFHWDGPALNECAARFRAFQVKFLSTLAAPRPPVRLLREVYVNQRGQIWTAQGEIIVNLAETIPQLQPTTVHRLGHGASLITSTDGIYHWMAQFLASRSWMNQPGAERLQVAVLPDLPRFKADSLRLAGLVPSQIVPVPEEACFFDTLHLTTISNTNLLFSRKFFRQFLERAHAEAALPPAAKIYISRKDSQRRVLDNEAELEKELEKRGFHVVVLSQLSLADQASLFSRAETIVAPHGGGLTHLMFAQPGAQVVEIVPAFHRISDRSINLRFNYARISMMKGLRYHVYLEECHMTLLNWRVRLAPVLRMIDSLPAPAKSSS